MFIKNEYIVCKDNKIFSLKDIGTGVSLNVNATALKCEQIKVDGGLIKSSSEKKCDWCIRIHEDTKQGYKTGTCLFIELKGSNFRRAHEQITNTIDWFKKNISDFHITKETYFVMRNKIPSKTSSDQVIIAKFKSHYKSVLKGVHSKTTVKYPETAS